MKLERHGRRGTACSSGASGRAPGPYPYHPALALMTYALCIMHHGLSDSGSLATCFGYGIWHMAY